MTAPSIGWALGLILFFLLPLIVVAVAAVITHEDRDRKRRRDWVAERHRIIARNGFKSRLGLKEHK
jgi:hypothetical protein